MKLCLLYLLALLGGMVLTRAIIDAQARADQVAMVRASADQRVLQATSTEQALKAANAQIAELQATVKDLAEDAQQVSDTVRLHRVLAKCAGVQP